MKLMLLLMAIPLCCASCGNSPKRSPKDQIYYKGTLAYERKAQGFKLTPTQAEERVAEFISAQLQDPSPKLRVTGDHLIIIGNAYHFSARQKMGEIPLTGYYVDGHTGRVEFRQVKGTVPYRHQIK